MKLEVGNIHVRELAFGQGTSLAAGKVQIDREELTGFIRELDHRISEVRLDIALPGDKTRIMPVKDVIEPRVKVEGAGTMFPGRNPGDEAMVGEGRTHVLKGMAVVTTGKVVGFQEGIIDMSGPGAEYTPFSKTRNLVITCEVDESCNQYDHEAILRRVGIETANHIGQLAKDALADEGRIYETKPLLEQAQEFPGLPKVGYIYMLQSQGLLHDTYLYGVDVKNILPTLLYPTEVMDGAIMSGNCVSACDKNPSIVHQNSPIIHELYEHHGTRYNFMGVIVTNENVTLADKERSSNYVAKLAVQMGLDAVIVSEEGFGNPDADLVMNCNKLEGAGIKTVLLTDEYAGQKGESQSLADSTPKGDAVVTNGNANHVVTLPAMEKVIGHDHYADWLAGGTEGSLAKDGSITTEIQAITGATNELGYHNLTAMAG
ncbi:glycine/sarcosine/betaine reductase component B subunit [Endozoicomonas gorgoniicola]|uniref:Glycine/sarcosine/betaine reductase component B subunit n=1 Tax=Endozoicomonas gorgoniicola TaxID=1234144 RepID=A0ABT3MUV0_9GAMM|nr:glycine/sarcosine/betaine reductase component B subunit [Endozoicomonas gorgoniicola]MCW7553142.1 glycine/sarcosine/betaine reductase component B subunit [Endozoicomonas gorgoniicola]